MMFLSPTAPCKIMASSQGCGTRSRWHLRAPVEWPMNTIFSKASSSFKYETSNVSSSQSFSMLLKPNCRKSWRFGPGLEKNPLPPEELGERLGRQKPIIICREPPRVKGRGKIKGRAKKAGGRCLRNPGLSVAGCLRISYSQLGMS